MLQPTLKLDLTELGDDLKAFLTTTWRCINLVDGKIRFISDCDFGKTRELRVSLTGNSSHWRIYLDARSSVLSTTHVLPMFVIV